MNLTSKKTKGFDTEASLVDQFVDLINSGKTDFGEVQITTEWDHTSGVVDVLLRDASESLIAFEAKLNNWQRAFSQAYRSSAYANRVYVLLPEATAHLAMRDQEEFQFRGIGLCAFNGKNLRIMIEAAEQDLLLNWVRDRAHDFFDERQNNGATKSRCGGAARVRCNGV